MSHVALLGPSDSGKSTLMHVLGGLDTPTASSSASPSRAVIHGPDLLLADEPTGNLDSRAGAEIVRVLEDLHEAGRTLVVVTHDAGLAARASRVVRMLDGAIVADEVRGRASR